MTREPGASGFRVASPVLVTDAHTMGAIAVVRSLGRAGYPVVAASDRRDALGLRSRFAAETRDAPSYDDPQAVVDWLARTVAETGAVAVVPSESLLLAIEPRFDEFSHLLPFRRDARTVYDGMSKDVLFRTFDHERGRRNLPRFVCLDSDATLPADRRFADWRYPLFAKVDARFARARESGAAGGGSVVTVRDAERLLPVLRGLASSHTRILVQEFTEGVGVGVFLLRWQGRELAHFVHRRLHEVPHTGGASSLRRAFRHEAMLEDARWRAEELGWEGVTMFEYRWDPATDAFRLLEMNGRFWGSLHLALYAGVDFPRLLLDAFLGHPETVEDYDDGVVCRHTFPRDVEYVLSIVRDARVPWSRRLAAVLEFPWLFVDPRVRSDLWFPGDRGLYWRSITATVRKFLA